MTRKETVLRMKLCLLPSELGTNFFLYASSTTKIVLLGIAFQLLGSAGLAAWSVGRSVGRLVVGCRPTEQPKKAFDAAGSRMVALGASRTTFSLAISCPFLRLLSFVFYFTRRFFASTCSFRSPPLRGHTPARTKRNPPSVSRSCLPCCLLALPPFHHTATPH